jgi:hypothetical protein
MQPQEPQPPKVTLKIDEHDLQSLRRHPENQEAFANIYESCCSWVRKHRGRLSARDVEDVVSQAIYETWDTLCSTDRSVEEVARALQKALNRVRARSKRDTSRYQAAYKVFDDYKKAAAAFREAEGDETGEELTPEEQEDHMLSVIRTLKGFLQLALESLSPREYVLLYWSYRFDQVGFKVPSIPLPEHSKTTRKVAEHRARHHFLNELERLFEAARLVLDEDRLLIDDALKLVRTGLLRDALLVYKERFIR